MAIRISTGLRDFIHSIGPFTSAFKGGKLLIYSGTQPTAADDAVAGTLLVTITSASGAHTVETPSVATVELTSGASGSVNSITVGADAVDILGAAVTYATSLANTASLCAAQINKFSASHYGFYAAVLSGAIITVYSPRGSGTFWNTKDITSACTTITATDTNFASGVAAVNGLTFGAVSSGVLAKGSETWSGQAGNSGTAGWFRLCGAIDDSGGSSTTLLRLDGNISTTGANLNMSSTSITAGATVTIDSFSVTMPAS